MTLETPVWMFMFLNQAQALQDRRPKHVEGFKMPLRPREIVMHKNGLLVPAPTLGDQMTRISRGPIPVYYYGI